MTLVKPPHLVDIEGTLLSPEVLFQRIYNPRKKTVISNLPLTGNAQYSFGQCEIYVLDCIQHPRNQGRSHS